MNNKVRRVRDGVVKRVKDEPSEVEDSIPPVIQEDVSLEPPRIENAIDPILVTNFTHQIVNPLSGIVGTLDNLLDGSTPPARQNQRLKAARAQLQAAIELVRNLAYLSGLSTVAGRQALLLKSGEVVLPKVIIEAIQFFQELADQKKIDIHLSDQITQYTVRGQPDLLRQVFINLIENGVKYGDDESKIEIIPRVRSSGLLIEIKSQGTGFRAAELERVFELGFRGADARDIKSSGSGIGLYICRQILELYGGKIWAQCSQQKRDVRFFIEFETHRLSERRAGHVGR